MKLSQFPSVLAVAITTLFALPVDSQARDRKITVLRDNDGDGHFNKKTFTARDRDRDFGRYRGGSFYGSPYYGSRYNGGRYFGGRSLGYPYGYGFGSPFRYGYGYGYPSYGYGYGYPSYGSTVTYYRSPSYAYSRSYGYDDDTAADVQRALKRRGYYRGSIDGDIGPGTRSAIRSYQANRGLRVTGHIDSSLLRSLGV